MATIQGNLSTFDVRWQILFANARVLWPIAETLSDDDRVDIRDTPKFELVVVGDGDQINAEIVWANKTGEWVIFIKTHETDSAEKAVQMLLRLTMTMMSEQYENNICREDATWRRDVAGLGYFYHPVELGYM